MAASVMFIMAAETSAEAVEAPPVTLTVTPGADGGPWKLTIQNTGETPVRLAADPRLLVLELTPAGSAAGKPKPRARRKKEPATLRCVLPDGARPGTDEGSELVVPAKRSFSATFDPLFYCFGARERAALVAGTTVKASFGWPATPRAKNARRAKTAKNAASPPFAVTPVGASVGQAAPAKAIEGAPFTLERAVTITPPTRGQDATQDDKTQASDVELTLPEAIDAARGVDIGATVTLRNRGDRPMTLLFRPETILFTVSGPGGTVSCGTPRTIDAPIRELFSTLAPKGKAQQTVLVTAICPADTFDEPGIYRVLPRIDTTGTSGRKIGLTTWDRTSTGKSPMLLRVRSPRRPDAARPRPALD